jgi:GxxExxY protein
MGEERAEFEPALMGADVPPQWNALTRKIIGAAMEVHTILGPGLLERIYEDALVHELQLRGLAVARQVPVLINYKGLELPGQRLDVVVEELVVVENKAIADLTKCHLGQLVSYMRAARMPIGLLLNFHEFHLRDGIHRLLNRDAFSLHSEALPVCNP